MDGESPASRPSKRPRVSSPLQLDVPEGHSLVGPAMPAIQARYDAGREANSLGPGESSGKAQDSVDKYDDTEDRGGSAVRAEVVREGDGMLGRNGNRLGDFSLDRKERKEAALNGHESGDFANERGVPERRQGRRGDAVSDLREARNEERGSKHVSLETVPDRPTNFEVREQQLSGKEGKDKAERTRNEISGGANDDVKSKEAGQPTNLAHTINSKAPTADNAENKTEGDEEDSPDSESKFDMEATRQYEFEQVAKLSASQMKRYEQYRRSDLKKDKVKKVLAALNPTLSKSNDLFVIAVKGLAKLFVGDIVESALDIQKQWGEEGPLYPKHIREAYRLLRREGVVPSNTAEPLFP